jgi:hypothetical protein
MAPDKSTRPGEPVPPAPAHIIAQADRVLDREAKRILEERLAAEAEKRGED